MGSVYAVYASVKEGTSWRRVWVFDSADEADRRAAGVVEEAPEPVDWVGKDGKGTRVGGDNLLAKTMVAKPLRAPFSQRERPGGPGSCRSGRSAAAGGALWESW